MKLRPEMLGRRSPVERLMSAWPTTRSSDTAGTGPPEQRTTSRATYLHGKLGAMPAVVTSPHDPTATRSSSERSTAEEHPFGLLRAAAAEGLRRQSADLALRWES